MTYKGTDKTIDRIGAELGVGEKGAGRDDVGILEDRGNRRTGFSAHDRASARKLVLRKRGT